VRGVQTLVGIFIVLLGCLHFADRDRPNESRRQRYFTTPSSPAGRGALALAEIVVGLAVLFMP
jgi:hypothetical protein